MKIRICLVLAVVVPLVLSAAEAQTEVDHPLIKALEATPSVRALILLAPAESPQALARVKDEVLAALPADAFCLGYRMPGLPILAGKVTPAAVRALMWTGRVQRIGLDETVRAVLSESAPIVGAPAVHTLGFTGKGTLVAVLDSGIDTDHPDLSDNLAPGAYHFLGGGSSVGAGAEDDFGHGTKVSGVITSGGVVAPSGIAPDADILAIKVLDRNGSGYTSDQVAALNYVVLNRATWPGLAAINMSLGTNLKYTQCPCDQADTATQALATAINAARAAGIPVFAAAGNGASVNSMPAPACILNAVSVGATYDKAYTQVTWSSCTDNSPARDQIVCITDRMFGCLDLLAPGALLDLSAMGGGKASSQGGTSFACPHAAAAAALLRQAIPCMTPDQMETAIEASGTPIHDAALNAYHPRLDIEAALGTLPRIEALDPFRNGWRVRLRLRAPNSAGLNHVAAASLCTAPKLFLGGGKSIALALDDLLIASFNLPAVFEGFTGIMDSRGEAIVFLNLPRANPLVGTEFYLGFFTCAASVKEVSWPLKARIVQ